MHHVVILSFFLLVSFAVVFNLSFLNTYMDLLRVGSLNINGGRDRHKLALVSEVMLNKKLHVILLQGTHSDIENEIEWGMWWKGQHILSHGTNLSAGVALLFSPERKVSIEKTEEFIKGRLVLVKTIIEGMTIYFINVYALL